MNMSKILAVQLALSAGILTFTIFSCRGRVAPPDCGDAGDYCVDTRGREMCCVPTFPYCGREGTDCPAGYCCNHPPR